jgi:hypothetical protein
MNFEVKPFGSEYFFEEESNVEELFYTYSGLRIIIETQKRKFVPVVLEVYFRYVNAFRCLDEGDLSAYRESGKFKTPHHIFEIHSGGWSNGELLESGILSVSSSVSAPEWFIKTTNKCVTVLSGSEPLLRESTRYAAQKDYVE